MKPVECSWTYDADLISLLPSSRFLCVFCWLLSLDERLHKTDLSSWPKLKHPPKFLAKSCPTFTLLRLNTSGSQRLLHFFPMTFGDDWRDSRRPKLTPRSNRPPQPAPPSSLKELKGKTTVTTAADGGGYIWHLGGSSSDVRSKIKQTAGWTTRWVVWPSAPQAHIHDGKLELSDWLRGFLLVNLSDGSGLKANTSDSRDSSALKDSLLASKKYGCPRQ